MKISRYSTLKPLGFQISLKLATFKNTNSPIVQIIFPVVQQSVFNYSMSLKRTSRQKGRTPSPITIYSNEIYRQKKSSVFTKLEQGISSRRASSKEENSKSLKQKGKYRIVTQPIEHFSKIQHLVNSNIFGNTSFHKMPQRLVIDRQNQLSEKKIKVNVKSNHGCSHCAFQKQKNERLEDEISFYKSQIQKIVNGIEGWKDGKISTPEFRKNFLKRESQNIKLKTSQMTIIKSYIQELVHDIQSLVKIDLVKMLKSQVFSYDIGDIGAIGPKVEQAKEILNQLRNSLKNPKWQSRVGEWSHQELMVRNLRLRVNGLLRENLQLKVKQQLLVQQIDLGSFNEQGLKIAIHNALNR